MNITFEPSAPRADVEENIVLNGRSIGTVKIETPAHATLDGDVFLAMLSFQDSRYFSGRGISKEDAICAAVLRAKNVGNLMTQEAANLADELGIIL